MSLSVLSHSISSSYSSSRANFRHSSADDNLSLLTCSLVCPIQPYFGQAAHFAIFAPEKIQCTYPSSRRILAEMFHPR